MKLGIYVTILGILGIIVGGAMYGANYHHTIGEAGVGLGMVLMVVGIALWMMKEKAPVAATPQQGQAKSQ